MPFSLFLLPCLLRLLAGSAVVGTTPANTGCKCIPWGRP